MTGESVVQNVSNEGLKRRETGCFHRFGSRASISDLANSVVGLAGESEFTISRNAVIAACASAGSGRDAAAKSWSGVSLSDGTVEAVVVTLRLFGLVFVCG